jgi:DNA-binding response OmpR family regulator
LPLSPPRLHPRASLRLVDLILLDVHLPGIDGEEVLRRLRADPGTADYLTKPLDVPRFLEVVNGLLVAATR